MLRVLAITSLSDEEVIYVATKDENLSVAVNQVRSLTKGKPKVLGWQNQLKHSDFRGVASHFWDWKLSVLRGYHYLS